MKVFITPHFTRPDRGDGGIRRVSEAQIRLLPTFGVEIAPSPEEADLIACHGTEAVTRPGVPMVHHSHGLMWAKHEWASWAHEVNDRVVQSMIRAVAHTAPSEWVANALRRGMLVYPEVIYHGVDTETWSPASDPQSFVVWNKARADAVSDPTDMQRLAELVPNVKFVSTLGRPTENVKVIGVGPVDGMREWVRRAGVYLATARETFGIATLEALACGVPVVGWNWGGQSEIVLHGVTGFLAQPHDYKALADGLRWAMAERKVLGANARDDAVRRWGWEPRVEQYAALYKRTRAWWDAPTCKVSVIVTCHNLGRFLEQAVRSVLSQDFKDFEILIVDDASDDDTPKIARRLAAEDKRVRYLRTPRNLKLTGAKNFGFRHSRGRYIQWLDADDMLADHALGILADALDADPAVHIVYGGLDTVQEDGTGRQTNPWPPAQFDWHMQMAHLNQLPSFPMVRREVMERTGGYRNRYWRAEISAFWCLATSFGFRAKRVTQAPTFIYRWRSDSKSKGEPGDGDWTAWFPWRLGATSGREGMEIIRRYGQNHPAPNIVPWSAQGQPPAGVRFWPVHDRSEPRASSVVIPCGPGHEVLLIDALDSLVAQTLQDWEVIVVNDTGKEWGAGFESPVAGAPHARVVTNKGKHGPGPARNLGAKYARAATLFFLDADDILVPTALEHMLELHLGTGGLIYGDWLRSMGDPKKPLELYEAEDFVCGDVLRRMRHSMACLIPRQAHIAVGGYDESLPGWEDWDYLIALQASGLCSYRLSEATFVYRFRTGTVRESSWGNRPTLLRIRDTKWADYFHGRKVMPCSKCPAPAKVQLTMQPQGGQGAASLQGAGEAVLLQYLGPGDRVTIRGPATGQLYRFSGKESRFVVALDAEQLLSRVRKGQPDFVRVETSRPRPPQSPEFASQASSPAKPQPQFPEMPSPDTEKAGNGHSIGDVTVRDLKRALIDAEDLTVLQWLQEERDGKARVTVIDQLEKELERRAEPEKA